MLCRLCLSEDEKCTDVLEMREGLPISVIVMIICPVKIELGDNLPKQICDECLQVVLGAYKLRDVSNNTERYLRTCCEEANDAEADDLSMTIEKIDEGGEEVFAIEEEVATAMDNNEMIEEEEEISNEDDYVVYEVGGMDEPRLPNPNFKYQVDCQNVHTKKSAVWNYFGCLMDENMMLVEQEKDFYFCKICVEQQQSLKPKYKAESIATSVLFLHLSRLHGLKKSEMSRIPSTNPTNHLVPELATCEICDKSFNSNSLLTHQALEHENHRSSEKSLKYKVNCFKTSGKSLAWDYFGALENCDGEQIDEYYFYCRLCVEEEEKLSPKYTKNTSTSILLQHLKNAHIPKTPEEMAKRKLPEPINVGSSSKRARSDDFACKVCGEELDSRKALNRHLIKEHNAEQPRNFSCQIEDCQKSFTMRDTLIKHIKIVHQGTKYPCNRCPTVLSTRMSLRRHIESCHLKIKSFSCDTCGSTYTEQKSLKSHVQKVHLGIVEKKIPCDHCDLQFTNQWSLRRHLLTHTGEVSDAIMESLKDDKILLLQKPHKCSLCSLAYASKGDLSKHTTKVHGDAVYKCEHPGCPAGFRLKNDLRDHYKVHFIEEEIDEDSEPFEMPEELSVE